MAVIAVPVLVWRVPSGAWAGALVEEPLVATLGTTEDDVVSRLSERLSRRYDATPWLEPPDFSSPRLHHARVSVRPRVRTEGRPHSAGAPISLRIPVVTGLQRDGATLVSVPTVGLRFHLPVRVSGEEPASSEGKSLRERVIRWLQEELATRDPLDLCRRLPPAAVNLASFSLRLAERRTALPPAARLQGLEAVAEPLTHSSFSRLFPVILERDAELAALESRLRLERGSVLLVGEAGVGKTSLLVEVARRVERVRRGPADHPSGGAPRFWMTCAARLVAGMKYLGQWEERCEQVVDELARMGGVLCVESLLDLVGRGGKAPSQGLAAFLAPYAERGELRLVAEATPLELDACRRLLPNLVDLFTMVRVPPLPPARALVVLRGMAVTLGRRHDVAVDEGVAASTLRLFSRFQPYAAFPGPAGRFLSALVERTAARGGAELGAADVMEAFSEHTGLPRVLVEDALPLAVEDVVDWFGGQVLGQEEACMAVAERVIAFKAGLDDPERPVGVLLFCGPTGVGKTEMARSLARFLFGGGGAQRGARDSCGRMVRLDMSEYGMPGAAARLVGDADHPGVLVREVRAQPFSVVLLDEIEKAAPEVFDVLLGMCDEGRLADSLGRVTTFRSCVIIMTSNLGSDAPAPMGFGPHEAPPYQAEVMTWFRAEFFNRIDAVVSFRPLGGDVVRALVRRELEGVAGREGLTRHGLHLAWTPGLEEHLARHGTDVRNGARPLQRAVESLVVAPLARLLVLERPPPGARIEMDVTGAGAVSLRWEPGAAPRASEVGNLR